MNFRKDVPSVFMWEPAHLGIDPCNCRDDGAAGRSVSGWCSAGERDQAFLDGLVLLLVIFPLPPFRHRRNSSRESRQGDPGSIRIRGWSREPGMRKHHGSLTPFLSDIVVSEYEDRSWPLGCRSSGNHGKVVRADHVALVRVCMTSRSKGNRTEERPVSFTYLSGDPLPLQSFRRIPASEYGCRQVSNVSREAAWILAGRKRGPGSHGSGCPGVFARSSTLENIHWLASSGVSAGIGKRAVVAFFARARRPPAGGFRQGGMEGRVDVRNGKILLGSFVQLKDEMRLGLDGTDNFDRKYFGFNNPVGGKGFPNPEG